MIDTPRHDYYAKKIIDILKNIKKKDSRTLVEIGGGYGGLCFQLLKRSFKLTVSNAGVRSVDKRGSFDEFLKNVKNKNLSPRLKKLKKSLLIKSPYQKKIVQSKTA